MILLKLVFSVLALQNAYATLTVSTVSPYTISDDDIVYFAWTTTTDGERRSVGSAGTYYVDWLESFQSFQFTNTDTKNLIYFDITTDNSSSDLYFGLWDTDAEVYVPIKAWGATSTFDSSTCSNCTSSGIYSYLGSIDSTSTYRVGFYPYEICAAITKATDGCNADGTTISPSSTAAAIFRLSFRVNTKASDTELNSSYESDDLGVRFVSEPSNLECFNIEENYTPTDGGLKIRDSVFDLSKDSNGADSESIIMVAEIGSAFDSVDYYNNNDITNRFAVSTGERTIGGFQNSTDGANNKYEVVFGARDTAGIINLKSGSCSIRNFQATQILGLLDQDDCFIATAAFENKNTWPVKVLRKFRDQYLLKSGIGRTIVTWYYEWSPKKADWLKQHTEFRLVVKLLLLPLVLASWLLLNPLSFAALLPIGGYLAWRRFR